MTTSRDDDLAFGRWLKHRRQALDLTQDELAERVGYASPTLQKVERGVRRPSRELAERLADVLEIAAADRPAFLRLARGLIDRPSAAANQSGNAGGLSALAPSSRPSLPPDHAGVEFLAEPVRQRRASLPVPSSLLIGREAERSRLMAQLTRPSDRLVTLAGPGGIGKTRLALQVAADLAPSFADGAAFVALAPIADAADVASAVARAVGCPLPGILTPEEHLLAFLRERALLLVLDNLEHLLAPEQSDRLNALIAAIVREAREVRLLLTSRERLRLRDERLVELGGLSLPGERAAEIARSDAVLLFLERARQSTGDFALTPDNRAAVARICRLLDGAPLAIELAAAWVRTISCAEIADEVAKSLDFLALSDRDADPRHRSMRAVIDHSWQLLTLDERQVLARLSVFRDGCGRAAAEAVAGATLPVLASLIDKSLLRRSAAGRYELHELIRQYAAEKLAVDPATEYEARQRHGTHFAALLQEALPRLESSDQAATLREMAAELANLRLAWEWAIAQHDFAALRAMAWSLWLVYEMHSRVPEVAALVGQATEALRAAAGAGPSMAPELRQALGLVLTWDGWARSRSGEVATAAELLREGAALLAEDERELAAVGSLGLLGMTLRQLGQFAEARAAVERNLALLRPRGISFLLAVNTIYLGYIAQAQGNTAEARALVAEARTLAEANGSLLALVSSLVFGAAIANEQGEPDTAEAMARKALQLSALHQDRWGVAMALLQLGLVALARGEIAEGRYLLVESMELCEELGEHWLRGRALVALGAAERASGDQSAAQQAWLDALRLARATGMAPLALSALCELAALAAGAGAAERALALLTHVIGHPGAEQVTRARAIEVRASLDSLIAPSRAATLAALATLDDFGLPIHPADGPDFGLTSSAGTAIEHPKSSASGRIQTLEEPLTEREIEVLQLLAAGRSNLQIADELVLAVGTVKRHVNSILGKLRVPSRLAAVARARELNLLD